MQVLQCRHLIPALNAWAAWALYTTTLPIAALLSFLDIDAWMTSQMNVALIRKLRGSLMCLAYSFLHVTHGCFNNQALTDVRSTGA